jgi:hypothetical protein
MNMSTDPKDQAPVNQLTHADIRDGLMRNHADIVGAVHEVLRNAGLSGLTVSSLRFMPPEGLSGPCNPPCPEGKHCEFDSNGGDVKPVCVPD